MNKPNCATCSDTGRVIPANGYSEPCPDCPRGMDGPEMRPRLRASPPGPEPDRDRTQPRPRGR